MAALPRSVRRDLLRAVAMACATCGTEEGGSEILAANPLSGTFPARNGHHRCARHCHETGCHRQLPCNLRALPAQLDPDSRGDVLERPGRSAPRLPDLGFVVHTIRQRGHSDAAPDETSGAWREDTIME